MSKFSSKRLSGDVSIMGILFVGMMAASCATTISGKVSSAGVKKFNQEEARVNIALLNTGEQEPYSAVVVVSETGAFQTTDDLPKGRYLVEALVPGYEASSQTIEIDGSKTVAIELTPLKTKAGSSVRANMDLDVDRGTGGALLTPPNL